MIKGKQPNSKIEKQTGDKSSSAYKIKDRLERLKEKEKQKSFTSDEFQYETNLYGFDTRLTKKLKQEYKSVKLEKHFAGNNVKNDYGQCYSIVDQLQVKIKCTDHNKPKKTFLSELRIVNGIGEFYEKKLKIEGYKTVNDLLKHQRFCFLAKEFLEILNEGNGHKLMQWLERRYSKSHQLVFLSSSFYSMEDFIFIDIESLGLHGSPLFLIGIAYFENQHLKIEQILARDMDEEAAVLAYLNEKTQEKK